MHSNSPQNILLGKLYSFEVAPLAWGPLDKETLHTIFKDGRASSLLTEHCLEFWFPELKRAGKDAKGFDHYWSERKVEVKGFTKGGCNFLPSKQIGAGRVANPEKALQELEASVLCVVDIVDFPKVHVRFVDHAYAYKKFPTGKIKRRERNYFFKKALDKDDI